MADPVSATTFQVPAGSSSTQIQSIIDGANYGDTISFAPGTYTDIKLVINKTLNLVGNGAIIKGINETSTNIFTLSSDGNDASGSVVEGFEFYLLNNNVTVGTKLGSTGYAVNLAMVSNVVVKNVTSHDGKAAVYNNMAKNTLVENCTFDDRYMYCYGVHIMGGNNITVRNNSISGSADAISMASSATNITIDNNTLMNNAYAVFYGGSVSNITVINNMFNGFYEGLGVEKSANLTSIINNTFVNGWGNSTAQKASGDAIYIKNSDAHGPTSVIASIEIIGNIFKDILGAAIGIDNTSGQGWFHAVGTGDSISGSNNSVTNVSKGYVVLHSQGQDLNFTMDSYIKQQPLTPVKANVSISSGVDSTTIKTGDKTTYTVTVKNIGNGNATNVKVSDILKSAFYSSYTFYSSLGTYSNGNWNIGTLSAGNTASLLVTATALKSGITSSQAKLKADNNITAQSNVIKKTIGKNVKLSCSNSVSSSNVKVGNYVILTSKFVNSGKDVSNPVSVKMTLPKDMKLVKYNCPSVYNKTTKTWTFTVPAGKSYSFQTTAKVTSKGIKTVKFDVNGKTQNMSIKGY